jgi:hypothetical protein
MHRQQQLSTLSRADQQAAAEAYAKMARREKLSSREASALKRFEKDREEQLRWQFYAAIPQKHWRQMSGRQTKVINEQAARYGLPFGGPTINLPELARAIHNFLAANAQKLAADDELLTGASSLALERYREERAALARLDRLQREGQLLPRDQVREALAGSPARSGRQAMRWPGSSATRRWSYWSKRWMTPRSK